MSVLPTTRPEIVEWVRSTLAQDEITDKGYSLASALMTRWAITAEELNR